MHARNRLYYLILSLVFLTSCSWSGNRSATIDADKLIDPISIRLEEAVRLSEDVSISFIALKNDGRCPLGGKCIWEGELEADFMVWKEDGNILIPFRGFPYTIASLCEEEDLLIRTFDDYKIVLTRVDPYPALPPIEVDVSETEATIRIFPRKTDITRCED